MHEDNTGDDTEGAFYQNLCGHNSFVFIMVMIVIRTVITMISTNVLTREKGGPGLKRVAFKVRRLN